MEDMKWINVKDRLPDKDGPDVLAVYADGSMEIYSPSLVHEYSKDDDPLVYWMPLPEPPKEE